jgi:D-sedoheptulose 7-phosphate isomerase
LKPGTINHLNGLISRHPELSSLRDGILRVVEIIVTSHNQAGKVMVCGNGGSAADSEHIVGELMKGFLLKREIPASDMEKLKAVGAGTLGTVLQTGIQAISLTGHISLSTAVLNDNDPLMAFAQQVYVYGRPGDVLLGLSTSGNAKNVINAIKVAKAFGVSTIGFTGSKPALMDDICDVIIKVPEVETFLIQELHLPVYHTICAMAEEEIFGA